MADPFSIATGIVGLLGAAGKSAQGLEKALELRHADEDFAAVVNELSDLKVHLQAIEISLGALQREDISEEDDLQRCLESFARLIERCQGLLRDLDDVVNTIRRSTPILETDENPKVDEVSKRAWIRQKSKLKRLANQIGTLSSSLSGTHTAVNTILATSQRRNFVQLSFAVQEIRALITPNMVTNEDSTDGSLEAQLESVITSLGQHNVSAILNDTTNDAHTITTSPSPLAITSSLESNPVADFVTISAAISSSDCRAFCPCNCHARSLIKSPLWVTSFIGSIMFHSNGTAFRSRQPCNLGICRRSGSNSTQLTYIAPSWAFMRAVTIQLGRKTINGMGRCFLYSPRVIPFSSTVWPIIEMGDLDGLKEILCKRSIAPYDVGIHGSPLLKWAASKGKSEICRFLINIGADPYYRNSQGFPAIQPGLDEILTSSHQTGTQRSLFENEELDPNLFATAELLDQQDFTRLHRIVLGLSSGSLEDQLELDVKDIDTPDSNGRTPLLWAAWKGDFQSVQLLLKYRADPNNIDADHYSPLGKAAAGGHQSCVDALLAAGALIEQRTFYGTSIIHLACRSSRNAVSTVKKLCGKGANLNSPSDTEGTPLHVAANTGSLETTEYLVNHGVDIEATDQNGYTPAAVAPCTWNEPTFLYLLDQGADMNHMFSKGISFLHFAAWTGSPSMLEALVKAARAGRMLEVDTGAKHDEHDLWHCFGKCRDHFYARERPNRDTEVALFTELLEAVEAAKSHTHRNLDELDELDEQHS